MSQKKIENSTLPPLLKKPRTPLFPPLGYGLEIKQGKAGDCFLLASIDSLYKLKRGEEKIKKMFELTNDGTVTVRIKREENNNPLPAPQKNKLAGKCEYKYENGEDVFTFSDEQLNAIDQYNPFAAQTNSLAVKILEFLAPYYFSCDWDPTINNAHLIAYKDKERTLMSDWLFMSYFLGVEVFVTRSKKFLTIRAFLPQTPACLGIEWGEHSDGSPCRHAVRVGRILPNNKQPQNPQIEILNPWGSTLTEFVYLNQIKKRKPEFIFYSTDKANIIFIKNICKLTLSELLALASNPGLQTIVKQSRTYRILVIRQMLNIFTKFPLLNSLYESLLEEQNEGQLASILKNSQGNLNTFLHFLLQGEYGIKIAKKLAVYPSLPHEIRTRLIDLALKNLNLSLYTLLKENHYFNAPLFSAFSPSYCYQRTVELEVSLPILDLFTLSVVLQKYFQLHSGFLGYRDFKFLLGENYDQHLQNESWLIEKFVKQINQLPLSFDRLVLKDRMEQTEAHEIGRIKAISFELYYQAFKLNLKDSVLASIIQAVKNALDNKVLEVKNKSAVRLKELIQAEETIKTFVKRIHDFTYSFKEISKTEEVENYVLECTKKLNEIANDSILVSAQKTLGLKLPDQEFVELIRLKDLEITSESKKYVLKLRAVAEANADLIKKIDNLTIDFKNCHNPEAVQARLQSYLNTLEKLASPSEMEVEAIKNTMEVKKDLIIKASKEALRVIAEAEKLFTQTMKAIEEYPIVLTGENNFSHLDNLQSSIMKSLQELISPKKFENAENVLGESSTNYHQNMQKVMAEKQAAIQKTILKEKNELQLSEIKSLITRTGVANGIEVIFAKEQDLKTQALTNKNYIEAAKEAEKLISQLKEAQENLLRPNEKQIIDVKARVQLFNEAVSQAILNSRQILEQHRGMKEILNTLVLAIGYLISFCTLGYVSRLSFFKVQTKSAQTLNHLENCLAQLG